MLNIYLIIDANVMIEGKHGGLLGLICIKFVHAIKRYRVVHHGLAFFSLMTIYLQTYTC